MNASARTMLGFIGLSAGLLSVAGCPTGGDGLPADAPARGGGVGRITDGSSNTILIGENEGGARGGGRGDGSVRQISDGSSNTVDIGLPPDDPTSAPAPSDDSSGGAADNSAALAAIRAALADQLFHFASSSGNSDNNAFVTGVTDLQLCDFGRFGMREFTSFASSVGDFSSEHFLSGTWAVQESGGSVFVVLTVEQSTRQNEDAQRALLLQQDRAGTFLFDGAAADSENVAADCAAAAQQSAGAGAP